jgi:hypothetical protein
MSLKIKLVWCAGLFCFSSQVFAQEEVPPPQSPFADATFVLVKGPKGCPKSIAVHVDGLKMSVDEKLLNGIESYKKKCANQEATRTNISHGSKKNTLGGLYGLSMEVEKNCTGYFEKAKFDIALGEKDKPHEMTFDFLNGAAKATNIVMKCEYKTK